MKKDIEFKKKKGVTKIYDARCGDKLKTDNKISELIYCYNPISF